jgi:vitamin B12 transporter
MPLRGHGAPLGLLALLAAPVALSAQQPLPSDSTPRDTLRPYAFPPLVVTATRVPAAQPEIGFATSLLDRRDLTAEPTPYAARALAVLPGVSIDEATGPGGPTTLHLRGADEPFTQMMFDGVAINISGGFNDIDGLLLTNVERVELARGPLSALWGSSAMAGAVQFVTRQGEPGPTRFEFLAEGGGASERGGQTRSELLVAGGNERLRYSSGFGLAYNRGIYALPNDLLSSAWSLRLDTRPTERWTVSATARYMAIQTNLPVRDPGVTRVPLDPNQRDRHYRWLGSLSTDLAATPTWHHRLTASLLWDEFVYEDATDSLLNAASYPFFVFNYNFSFRSTLLRPGVEYVASHEVPLGRSGQRLALSYGAQWQREAEVTNQAGDFGPAHSYFSRANAAVFTELQGRLGTRLSVLAGARLDKFRGLDAELLPRASVVVAVVPDRLALRLAAGRAFKAPNVDQQFLDTPASIPNPGLKPESSESWEVGATVTAPRRALTIAIGYFHQRYNDLIQTVPADTGSKQTNKNLGRTQTRGVEAEVERWWSERWRTGASVSWVRTEVLDNRGLDPTGYPVGGSLPAVPSVTGNVHVTADLTDAVTAVARVTLVGTQTVFTERFSGQRVPVDPYALLELVAQWHRNQALTVYARIDNLLNTSYQTAFDRPGSSRTAVLGVRMTPH